MVQIKQLLVLLILMYSSTLSASFVEWQLLETDHYRIYHHKDHEQQAKETANELEFNRSIVQEVVGNVPPKMPVVIEDFGQVANGFASPLPLRMNLMLNQPNAHFFGQRQSFLRMLTTHELTHTAHFTEVSGLAGLFKRLFGNFFYPNLYSAPWMFEGLAVYVESQNSPYEGRLNDAEMNAYFQQTAKEGKLKSLGEMTLYFNDYLSGRTPYFYGARFTHYLADNYGQDKLGEFLEVQGQRTTAIVGLMVPSLSLDLSAKKTYGKPFSKLVDDWHQNETKKSSEWKIEGDYIDHGSLYKQYLSQNSNSILMTHIRRFVPYPFGVNDIHSIYELSESGEKKRVLYTSSRKIEHPPILKEDWLYYTHKQIKSGYHNVTLSGYGYTHELWRKNVKTKKKVRLLVHDISAYTVLDDHTKVIASHKPGEFSTQIDSLKNNVLTKKGSLPFLVSEIMSYKNDYIVIGKKMGHTWNIFKVNEVDLSVEPLYEGASSIAYLGLHNQKLTFTVTYKKTKHLYALNLETKTLSKLSQGSYLRSGIETDISILGLVINASGDKLVRQDKNEAQPAALPNNDIYTLSTKTTTNKNTSAIKSSMKGVLKPFVYPLPFMSADEMGTLSYSMQYTPYTGLTGQISTSFFQPWDIGIVSRLKNAYVSIKRPIYESLHQGVQHIHVGAMSDLKEENLVSLESFYSHLNHSGSLKFWHKLKTGSYKIDWTDKHSYKNVAYKWRLSTSQGLTDINYMRGFAHEVLLDAYGQTTSLDITKRLFSLPKSAMWSPTIAVGALYVGAFVDTSTYSKKTAQGGYLSYEFKASLFGLRVVPSAGLAYSNGEGSTFVAIEGFGFF
jgi:hypothetical protein